MKGQGEISDIIKVRVVPPSDWTVIVSPGPKARPQSAHSTKAPPFLDNCGEPRIGRGGMDRSRDGRDRSRDGRDRSRDGDKLLSKTKIV